MSESERIPEPLLPEPPPEAPTVEKDRMDRFHEQVENINKRFKENPKWEVPY
jgi:hypothetical protein